MHLLHCTASVTIFQLITILVLSCYTGEEYMNRSKSIPIAGIIILALLFSRAQVTNAQSNDSEYVKYKDENAPIMERVKDLLGRMTLKEKIGQMVQIDQSVANPDVLRDYSIGSVLTGGGDMPKLGATVKDWVDMVNDFQNGSMSSRLGIPMLYAIDAVHGNNNVYKATIFPHNIGLGATRDPDLVRRIGEATALEVRATGIPYVFAPCLAVCRDPRWGRCYESYSEDPQVVESMTSIIEGLQGSPEPNSRHGVPYISGSDKVASCAYHYVGDGGTTGGINENNTEIDRHGLLSIHMAGYYSAVIKGVSSIMVSISSWNGIKMHANRELLTQFLKGTLRFRGFIISDWEGIDKITDPPGANYTYSVETGINAGIDMVTVPFNYTDFIGNLTDLVNKDVVSMGRIDDAVRRILRVKFDLGLFEKPMADYSLIDHVGSQEHRDLAREAVRKSLVLLKNGKDANSPVIPLQKKVDRILVAGTHSNNLAFQCGGWTISWQGLSGNNYTAGTTIFSAIASTVHTNTEVVYSRNPDPAFVRSSNFSYAIVVVGEYPYAESVGDNPYLSIRELGLNTIHNVCKEITCVVVLITGRPVVMEPYLKNIDALVAAWLPGTEGQGVADVLFGDFGFTGKLPRTWFKTVDQLPMNVGDPNYDPLFPFGFGIMTEAVNSGNEHRP